MTAAAAGQTFAFSPLTTLSEEEELFRSSVREFAEGEVRPRVEKMEHAAKLDQDLIKQLFELGLMAIESPEEFGGAGSTIFNAILAIEELARVDASISVFMDVHNTLVTNAFMRWANDDQKKKYLPQMAASRVGAYALSEAGSGSDAFALTTRAVDKGDHYELTGQKLWITNGNEAEIFIVFATIDPSAGYKGITAFIVEKQFEGFTVGKKEDKLGIRASSTTELILDNCKVPKENVLGEVGKGYKVSIETLNEGRIGIGAQMLGHRPGCVRGSPEIHGRTRAIRPIDQQFPGRPVPACRDGRRDRSDTPPGLQCCTPQGCRQAVPQGSRNGKALFITLRRSRRLKSDRALRRLRLREGLPGRKILARLKDRLDLRRHVKHAASNDREDRDEWKIKLTGMKGMRDSGIPFITFIPV
jgi:alkylation response protein AidB-like acyl-CoA dehydrogenase